MEKLLEGFRRYKAEVYPQQHDLFQELAWQQKPDTLFIACSDSRLVPGMMLQAGPGELFVCRNAGNIVPSYGEHAGGVSATIEYAVQVLKVKDVVICGHSDCGAMRAALHPESVAAMPGVSWWLRHVERAAAVVNETHGDADEATKLRLLTEENVLSQLDHLMTHPMVAAKVRIGALRVHGWVLDLPRAELRVHDREAGRFVSVTAPESPAPKSIPA